MNFLFGICFFPILFKLELKFNLRFFPIDIFKLMDNHNSSKWKKDIAKNNLRRLRWVVIETTIRVNYIHWLKRARSKIQKSDFINFLLYAETSIYKFHNSLQVFLLSDAQISLYSEYIYLWFRVIKFDNTIFVYF